MSPGFPRAELASAENDCPECSDSMLPGHVFVFDLHHMADYRPCPRCNPEGREGPVGRRSEADVVADEVRRLRARRGEGGR